MFENPTKNFIQSYFIDISISSGRISDCKKIIIPEKLQYLLSYEQTFVYWSIFKLENTFKRVLIHAELVNSLENNKLYFRSQK